MDAMQSYSMVSRVAQNSCTDMRTVEYVQQYVTPEGCTKLILAAAFRYCRILRLPGKGRQGALYRPETAREAGGR